MIESKHRLSKTAFSMELLPILKTYANIEISIFYIVILKKAYDELMDDEYKGVNAQ